MSTDNLLPVPDAILTQRLILAERDCMRDWLRAMQAVAGNPFGVEIREFGQTTALVCRRIPAQVFNRVFNMTSADKEHIPEILDFYRENGATPLFDLDPYRTEPYWEGENIPVLLAHHRMFAGASHQLLYGVPANEVPPLPKGVTINEVQVGETSDFTHTYEQVWGDGSAIKVLVSRSEFKCYMAYVEGQPAALGVLHVANGSASMANALTVPAFRNRGCQTALLYHRMSEATRQGCDLLVSQCSPGTTSQRNQLHAGFQIAGTKSWWVPLPEDGHK